MNSWCIISPLHKDFTQVFETNKFTIYIYNNFNITTVQEPFICVSIGGHKIPEAQLGVIMVWAVTAQGRVNRHLYTF